MRTYRVRTDMVRVARIVISRWRHFSPGDLLRAVHIIEAHENRREFRERPEPFCPQELRTPRSAPRSVVGRVVVASRPEAGVMFFGGRR